MQELQRTTVDTSPPLHKNNHGCTCTQRRSYATSGDLGHRHDVEATSIISDKDLLMDAHIAKFLWLVSILRHREPVGAEVDNTPDLQILQASNIGCVVHVPNVERQAWKD